jgi:hypothetical protein
MVTASASAKPSQRAASICRSPSAAPATLSSARSPDQVRWIDTSIRNCQAFGSEPSSGASCSRTLCPSVDSTIQPALAAGFCTDRVAPGRTVIAQLTLVQKQEIKSAAIPSRLTSTGRAKLALRLA